MTKNNKKHKKQQKVHGKFPVNLLNKLFHPKGELTNGILLLATIFSGIILASYSFVGYAPDLPYKQPEPTITPTPTYAFPFPIPTRSDPTGSEDHDHDHKDNGGK